MSPQMLTEMHYEMARWDWEENTIDPSTIDLFKDRETVCVWRCPKYRHRWEASVGELMTKGGPGSARSATRTKIPRPPGKTPSRRNIRQPRHCGMRCA